MLLPLILAATGYSAGLVHPEPLHEPVSDETGMYYVEYGDPASGIPVVCYHQVSSEASKYSVTANMLRYDLEEFYEAGFSLITSEDLENGLMQFPSDRRPMMMTFDDGWQDNFSFLLNPDGTYSIDPDCAVAILEDFTREHPDFGGRAIFFLSWDKVPFGQEEWVEEKLNLLLDMGHEIGNHTWRHRHFSRLLGDQWSPAILRAMELFEDHLGIRTWTISSVSWPGGSIQDGSWVTQRIADMEFEGRPAVDLAFLVDGAISSFRRVLPDADRRIRISRIDMSQYSVGRILQWPNLMDYGMGRADLHSPLPWRP
jgi:peptidoglycan/xylan/chitin deacetylase (PgdA/CDA1 family)